MTVAISSNGNYIVDGCSWPNCKIYLFNNSAATLKTPLWSYQTGSTVQEVAISSVGECI